MATIKSYTDISQSKKLTEILSLESADMCYFEQKAIITPYNEAKDSLLALMSRPVEVIPCWSLAALLEQFPYELCDDDGNSAYLQMNKEDDVYQLVYTDPHGDFESIETDRYEHFVDACVAMIEKLNELKML